MAPKPRRTSAFQEVGLTNEAKGLLSPTPTKRERPQSVRFRSRDEVHLVERYEDVTVDEDEQKPAPRRVRTRQYISLDQTPLPASWSSWIMYRLGAVIVIFAALLPILQARELFGHGLAIPIRGAEGAVIPEQPWPREAVDLQKRDDSPTYACFRWAQMSAIVNGTLYLYGGQATTESSQTQNTWNNNFLTLDLTKTWPIGGPKLNGLPQPDGPPEVALGYLWNSYDSLFLYGGQFSWKPPVDPAPFSTWEYQISSGNWVEHSDPVTTSGESAPDGGAPVQRSSEGAGANIPSLGRGFYFGGHQDGYTTPGWDQSIYRIYLQSLLEYTFPGYENSEVPSIKSTPAGSDGVYRNITQGGLQAEAGFTQRADGLLIYIPGFGDEGILLALAGGTNETFTQMNNINIYDIATSSWYTQATSGETPDIRVNPCAVTAVAQDGSSYNIYMFGGQNLLPYGSQKQKDDMWILTLPSFTWIKIDQGGQSVPYGRSGATCNIWDAQMVMVGGYLGNAPITCESPGIYVFDLSNLQWVQQFTALSAAPDALSADQNPLNQQPNQRYSANNPGGLEGSYGYEVPDAVISVVGGGKTGGATLTTPVVTASAGPLKTGSPITYTVTESNGVVTTETASAGKGSSISSDSSDSGNSGPNIAAIVVGTVCGLLFLVICYLLFCLYLYRKQLALYKHHVEMSQRQARGEKPPAIPGLWQEDSDGTSATRRMDDNGNLVPGVGSSKAGSGSHHGSQGQTSGATRSGGYQSARRSSEHSDTEDLLAGQEPTFVGVMLHPRRSLRVTNRD